MGGLPLQSSGGLFEEKKSIYCPLRENFLLGQPALGTRSLKKCIILHEIGIEIFGLEHRAGTTFKQKKKKHDNEIG